MAEWFVDIQSLIPIGRIGERMVVARRDNMSDEYAVMCAPTIRTVAMGQCIEDTDVFMESHTLSPGRFGQGEIDQFLQAMMEAGWRRGLRPKNFDPSAGELAAVNRHLEDMRKVAMGRPPGGLGALPEKAWQDSLENQTSTAGAQQSLSSQELRNDEDKHW